MITEVTMMSRMRPTSRRHHSASTAPSGSTSLRCWAHALLVGVAVAGRRHPAALPLTGRPDWPGWPD